MYKKTVKDLMIPVHQYPAINQNESMYEAMLAVKKANANRLESHEPFRAVLVLNDEGRVVGKIGMLAFLKALEPNYKGILDLDKLTRISLSSVHIETMISQFNLWKSDSADFKRLAERVKAKEVMSDVHERIEQDESIVSAIHKIIMWQSVSILVSDGNEIVGILRLKDLYLAIEDFILNNNNNHNN